MRRLLELAYPRLDDHGYILVSLYSALHMSALSQSLCCSLAVMVISILYSSLLHYIKQFDTTVAYALHNADKGGAGAARRESRRESLILPIPNSYQTVEGGGGNSRAGM